MSNHYEFSNQMPTGPAVTGMGYWKQRALNAEEAIMRIAELHNQLDTAMGITICSECISPHPCPTSRAVTAFAHASEEPVPALTQEKHSRSHAIKGMKL